VSRLDVADAVERCVESREAQCPRVQVRRDDVIGVGGEQDRLDPVSGPHVERTFAVAPNRQVGKRHGGAVHAGDVVRVPFGRARVVGRDQQLVVRHEPRRAVDDLVVLHEQPGCPKEGPKRRAHELVEARACDRDAEQEESKQDGQLVCVTQSSQVGRQLRRASEELVAGGEPFLDLQRLVARESQEPSKLDGRLRALRSRRLGAPRRGDGADRLQGCVPASGC